MTNWDFYPDSLVGVDLREDLEHFLSGGPSEPGKGRPVIHRKITNIRCACFRNLEGSPDQHCAYCRGEGYRFTERLIDRVYVARNFGSVLGPATQIGQQNFLSSYGFTDSQKALAIVRHYDIPDYETYLLGGNPVPDALYEVKVNDDGSLYRPVLRIAKWRIRSLTPHHGDHGRIEFFELGLEKENL